jgi:hypothetical protein
VVEVGLRDPNWMNQIIIGEHAFPHEPFQLRGPSMPPGWRDRDPTPTVSLPRLKAFVS